jgi:hypothetical protein
MESARKGSDGNARVEDARASDSRTENIPQRAVTAGGFSQDGFTVERGPGWLFVRVPESGVRDTVGVVSGLLKTAMTNRVVLELDGLTRVDEDLADAIATLGNQVEQSGGVIRICGLSDTHLATIRLTPGFGRIPHYACRAEAVRAARDPALVQAGATIRERSSSSQAMSPPGSDGSRPT